MPAEHLDVSAVLAAVTVGCYVGWQAPRIASPATRLQGFGMWELLQFLLNAILFVLIGLQLPVVLDGLDGDAAGRRCSATRRRSAPRSCSTRLIWQQTVVFLDPRASTGASRCARGARRGSCA